MAGGAANTLQHWAKAYPGLRYLDVLRGFGANSIVASTCPKVAVGDANALTFGYGPAFDAIMSRIALSLIP